MNEEGNVSRKASNTEQLRFAASRIIDININERER